MYILRCHFPLLNYQQVPHYVPNVVFLPPEWPSPEPACYSASYNGRLGIGYAHGSTGLSRFQNGILTGVHVVRFGCHDRGRRDFPRHSKLRLEVKNL